jgi:hypothetical protein
MEAWGHGMSVGDFADECARLVAYGNQMILVHARLRDQLEDLRDGMLPAGELATHCLAFCAALTRHHTGEDETVFPLLAERHPELRGFLAGLRRDHEVIAGMLRELAEGGTEVLDGLAAVLETHFVGEEKRLAGVLNAVESSVRLDGLAE